MTNEDRALKWFVTWIGGVPASPQDAVASLAAQFAEVEATGYQRGAANFADANVALLEAALEKADALAGSCSHWNGERYFCEPFREAYQAARAKVKP